MDTREALAPPEASALFDRIWADHLRQAVEEAPKCSIESVFERLWDSAKSWVKRSANHREFRVANCLCLRAPRRRGEDLGAWYARCPLRPIVFEDPGLTDLGEPTPGADRESLIEPVHMHLEHRISQRLLGRFMSQGFMYNDLSIRELQVHLEKKAIDLETMVRKELGRAGEKEAENTRKLLEEQDKRIDKTLADREREEAIAKAKANEREAKAGPTLFDAKRKPNRFTMSVLAAKRVSEKRAMEKRKRDIEREILEEPDRIRGRYAVQTVRLEPVGIVYLWPEMG